jgi:hypothetical protein
MIISMIITSFGKVSSKLDFALSYCNNLQAKLSTFPFSKGLAALLMLFFLRPERYELAVVGVVTIEARLLFEGCALMIIHIHNYYK